MHDLKLKAAETARFLRARVAPLPRIAVLAGTGLGGLGDGLRVATALPYADIPHFPLATVQETIAAGGAVTARLPLPIAGLMSPEPLQSVARAMERPTRAARDLGSPLRDPFMPLSFLTLTVIPELKITDRGLVDVRRFRPVSLFIDCVRHLTHRHHLIYTALNPRSAR